MPFFNSYNALKAYCDNPENSLEGVELGPAITSLDHLFTKSKRLNEQFKGIEDWDVSSVTRMDEMFYNAYYFNRSLSHWNTSKVTSMSGMFCGAKDFNQYIGSWDVSNVRDMKWMFMGAFNFNQDISKWNVSKVVSMIQMFSEAVSFNQSLEKWDVSGVKKMGWMFDGASSFNKPLNKWKFREEDKECTSMFSNCPIDPKYYPWVEAKKTAEELRSEPMSEGFKAYRNYEDKLKNLFRLCA